VYDIRGSGAMSDLQWTQPNQRLPTMDLMTICRTGAGERGFVSRPWLERVYGLSSQTRAEESYSIQSGNKPPESPAMSSDARPVPSGRMT
jgi:hypothetical protein